MILGIEVDGARPSVEWVTSIPRSWRVTDAERLVLLALACDAFHDESAPGTENLAAWTGLHRSSVVTIIARLCLENDHRPALIERAETTRGGRRTTYRLLVHNRPAPPDGSVGPDRSGNRSGNRSAGPAGYRSGGPAAPYTPDPPPPPGEGWPEHRHEGNARRALAPIVASLPLGMDDVLPHAYRLGRGDPWEGYKLVKPLLLGPMDGVRDPRRALIARLNNCSPVEA